MGTVQSHIWGHINVDRGTLSLISGPLSEYCPANAGMLVSLTGWSTHSGKNKTKTDKEFYIITISINGFLPGAGHDVHNYIAVHFVFVTLTYIYYLNTMFSHNVIYHLYIILMS